CALLGVVGLAPEHVVDHGAWQQPVFTPDRDPCGVVEAMAVGLRLAAERGDEAAGRQLQRPDGLERMGGKRLFKAIQVERFGKAEQGQVAEEHGEWLPWSMWGGQDVRALSQATRRRPADAGRDER